MADIRIHGSMYEWARIAKRESPLPDGGVRVEAFLLLPATDVDTGEQRTGCVQLSQATSDAIDADIERWTSEEPIRWASRQGTDG
jgi:hypothetical protein